MLYLTHSITIKHFLFFLAAAVLSSTSSQSYHWFQNYKLPRDTLTQISVSPKNSAVLYW